eukprot:scaffold193885_cov39-Tisochrysis_lutea.AAC.2
MAIERELNVASATGAVDLLPAPIMVSHLHSPVRKVGPHVARAERAMDRGAIKLEDGVLRLDVHAQIAR